MTLTQILSLGNLKPSKHVKTKISILIGQCARENNIEIGKAEEIIKVNDYPKSFIPEMEKIIISYLTKNSEP